MNHHRIPRNHVEKTVGLAMWNIQFFAFMRIWLQCMQICTTIQPRIAALIPQHLCLSMMFTFQPTGTRILIGGRLVSVKHQDMKSVEEFTLVRPSDKTNIDAHQRPNCKQTILKCFFHAYLADLHHMAGIGGFIKRRYNRMALRPSLQDFRSLEIPLQDDLQESISALETLAQMAILWMASKLYPGQRLTFTLPSFWRRIRQQSVFYD